jgi:hypothetical protein
MNTNNSELEERPWRCFCDTAYYDYWAVQNKNYRSFHQAIHVRTQAEAQFLVDMLNSITTKDQEITLLKGEIRRYEMLNDPQSPFYFDEFEFAIFAEITWNLAHKSSKETYIDLVIEELRTRRALTNNHKG